jgi:NADPH:quinone reductase
VAGNVPEPQAIFENTNRKWPGQPIIALNFQEIEMHAWLCSDPVGYEELVWSELPALTPGAGEVRIEIKAASLNFPDILIVQNKYQMKPPLPFVPGSEFAGVVSAVGASVSHLKLGQRVACLSGTGGFATHTLAPAALCLTLPDAFPFEDAAAFIMTYATSHHALRDRAQLKAGETLLVMGAAGGVGTAAIQIGKALGARVIAAASNAEKCALCSTLGADATIDYSKEDLRQALKSLTSGKGPDVVYDPVGGDLTEAAFRSIAWRGRYLVIGFAAGSIPALPLNLALLKGASIVGVFWGDFAKREPEANALMLQELIGWHAAGKIKPVIHSTFPMAELKTAYNVMKGRGVMGKLVMLNA